MMASIAERTETTLPYATWNEERVRRDARDPAYTIAYSACAAARDLGLAALVIPTLSGPVGAADLRPPPQRADLLPVPGQGDRAALWPHVGGAGGVDRPPRGHRGADRGLRAAGGGARLGQAR